MNTIARSGYVMAKARLHGLEARIRQEHEELHELAINMQILLTKPAGKPSGANNAPQSPRPLGRRRAHGARRVERLQASIAEEIRTRQGLEESIRAVELRESMRQTRLAYEQNVARQMPTISLSFEA